MKAPHEAQDVWLFIGITAFGTIGCVAAYITYVAFTQAAANSPLSTFVTLVFETASSILRIDIWSWNPGWDNEDGIYLSADPQPSPFIPHPKSPKNIEKGEYLPLYRAPEFIDLLKKHSGDAADVDRFDFSDISLLYGVSHQGLAPLSSKSPCWDQAVLYIAIFDHILQKTRVYWVDHHDHDKLTFRAATLELKGNIFHTEVGNVINNMTEDPIACRPELRSTLKKHYDSISRQLRFPSVKIHCTWALKRIDADPREYTL